MADSKRYCTGTKDTRTMLTDLEITRTKPDPTKTIRLSDREGLHLRVLPDGRRSWRWDDTYNGRRKQPSSASIRASR